LSSALWVFREKIEGTNDKLAVEKGIGSLEFERGASVFIKNAEGHLKPAEHFHEPLVEQRGRQKNEDATSTARDMQAMQNETGFDCFSKAHLIREQDTRIHAG
jgi:hypothetical protein